MGMKIFRKLEFASFFVPMADKEWGSFWAPYNLFWDFPKLNPR